MSNNSGCPTGQHCVESQLGSFLCSAGTSFTRITVTTTSSVAATSTGSSSSVAAIAGACAGVGILAAVVTVGIIVLRRRRRGGNFERAHGTEKFAMNSLNTKFEFQFMISNLINSNSQK